MAADPWTIHNAAIEYIHDDTVSLEGDTLKMRLYTVGSNVNVSTLTDATTASNEVANAFNYVTGGTPVSVTISRTGGTTIVGCTDGVWNASGGTITARFAAIVDESTAPATVLFSTLLNNAPGDVSALDGNAFTVQIDPNGIYNAAAV